MKKSFSLLFLSLLAINTTTKSAAPEYANKKIPSLKTLATRTLIIHALGNNWYNEDIEESKAFDDIYDIAQSKQIDAQTTHWNLLKFPDEIRHLIRAGLIDPKKLNSRLLARPLQIKSAFLGNRSDLDIALFGIISVEKSAKYFFDLKTKSALIHDFLDGGADINAIDAYGWTPLMYAVMDKKHDLVRLLLERKANPYAGRNYYGENAYKLACKPGYERMAQLLKEKKATAFQLLNTNSSLS